MNKAFTLVELLIAMSLGIIVLLSLASGMSYFVKSYQSREQLGQLYAEASTIGKIWAQEFSEDGIKIYQVDRDSLPEFFPKSSVKKLLPHSVVILIEHPEPPIYLATYDQTQQQLRIVNSHFQKHELVMVGTYGKNWLLNVPAIATTGNIQYLKLSFVPPQQNELFWVAPWHNTLWFAMQNSEKTYGIYRLVLPEETTPAEYIAHVQSFQAELLPKVIRLKLTLVEGAQQLDWPMSFIVSDRERSIMPL
jgi:hypothetical protein